MGVAVGIAASIGGARSAAALPSVRNGGGGRDTDRDKRRQRGGGGDGRHGRRNDVGRGRRGDRELLHLHRPCRRQEGRGDGLDIRAGIAAAIGRDPGDGVEQRSLAQVERVFRAIDRATGQRGAAVADRGRRDGLQVHALRSRCREIGDGLVRRCGIREAMHADVDPADPARGRLAGELAVDATLPAEILQRR